MKQRGVIAATALLWMLTGSIAAHARTISVQKGSKIQKAINSAAAGDTVLVGPGTYFENINFHGKAITVTSAQGPKLTIIDGQGANSTVTFDSSETSASVLSGFTITHGAARGLPRNSDGGGILVSNDVGPTITNNIITQNCASSGGGGIALLSSEAIVKSNTITNNTQCDGTTGGCGGGIEVLQLSMPTIASNTISNNSWPSGDGGGICVFGLGFPLIENNLISGNAAFGSSMSVGGGIASFNSQPSIIQNVIVDNRADFGAGVSFDDSALLVNNTITGNLADQNAGSALYISGLGAAEVFNNLLIGAPVEDVVYCDPVLTIFSPVFENNDAFSPGGPPFIGVCEKYEHAFGNISTNPEFENAASNNYQLTAGSPAIDAGLNSATSLPATDFAGGPRVVAGTPGGATVVDPGAFEYQPPGASSPQPTPSATPTPIPPGTVLRVPQDFLKIQDAIDVASEGDVIEVSPGTYFENIDFGPHNLSVVSTGGPQVTTIDPHGLGPVVSIEGGQTNASLLEGFTLTEGYTGVSGGGISISRSSPVIRGNVITGNLACTGGGGIAVTSGSPIIEGNQISSNAQLDCIGGGGGGIWLEGPGTAQIIGNTISNHFWINGSGIWMDNAGSPLLMNNLIVDNLVGGGINITDNTTPTLIQNIVAGNTGGGIYFNAPAGPNGLNFINNTIAYNSTNTSYGPLASVEAAGTDDLVLFAGNLVISPGQVALKCDPFPGHMPPTFENNDVFADGGTALEGACTGIIGSSGNISADPRFADAWSLDLRLMSTSPAIDAGLNSAPDLPATDFYGGPRIVSGIIGDAPTVDIGAVEYDPNAPTPTATVTATPTPSSTPTIPPVLPTPTATRTPSPTFSPTPVPERIEISPKSLDLGKVKVGETSRPRNITVLNPFHNSGLPVSVYQPTVKGPFSASATCPAMLNLGDHCKITVTFQPTARKHYKEDLLINDNVVGSPQHVHVSGEGK